MHELSIANSIVTTVLQEMETRKLSQVVKIVVRVGVLSGVVPEALQFNFDAIKGETPLADTKLEIEEIAVQGRCHSCNCEFAVKDYYFICPQCKSGQVKVTRGMDLDIAFLEIDN